MIRSTDSVSEFSVFQTRAANSRHNRSHQLSADPAFVPRLARTGEQGARYRCEPTASARRDFQLFYSAHLLANLAQPRKRQGAIYKDPTIVEIDGHNFILAANFRGGQIDVFATNFNQVRLNEDAFDDDHVLDGFAPFNVQANGPNVFVTYSKQDGPKHDLRQGLLPSLPATFSSYPSPREEARASE